jgi:hypothetical protein
MVKTSAGKKKQIRKKYKKGTSRLLGHRTFPPFLLFINVVYRTREGTVIVKGIDLNILDGLHVFSTGHYEKCSLYCQCACMYAHASRSTVGRTLFGFVTYDLVITGQCSANVTFPL